MEKNSRLPENLSAGRQMAIEELIRGHEFATQLQIILLKSTEDHESVTAEELVAKILKSFTEALAVLNSGKSGENYEDPATAQDGSPCSDVQKIEDSGENRKRPASIDHPRGGYKRRKMVETWIKVTPKPIEDGHSWRKYGQKEILNAKYPRSYFRCTHKHDQGCLATKQIQKTEEENPPMYRTTYIGHHTCQDMLMKAPQFVMDSSPGEGFLLSFESNTSTKPEQLPSCFSSISSIKQEHKEQEKALVIDPKTHHYNQSSLEYFQWSDLPEINESSRPTSSVLLPSTPGSEDYGDVSGGYSCTTTTSSSHSSFDMSSVHFDEFKFDDLLY
ncbi:probable WRKY transcription factor 70 [Telopea speciosissima]|uniref:probable WRKY transcription factor 70 n=1 Tax=Telopea speciosissima TaxID=54955 RepID=UPI001CC3F3C6|nr:probable WRKY transcription factor 70 [Telopea speciosissima]